RYARTHQTQRAPAALRRNVRPREEVGRRTRQVLRRTRREPVVVHRIDGGQRSRNRERHWQHELERVVIVQLVERRFQRRRGIRRWWRWWWRRGRVRPLAGSTSG